MATAKTSDRLLPNQELEVGQSLVSADGRFKLDLQADGNLVEYGPQAQPLWATNTTGDGSHILIFQDDGNLVIYDGNNKAVWSTGTAGLPGAYAVLQNDGNFVVYGTSQQVLWANNSTVPGEPAEPTQGDRLFSNQGLVPGQELVSVDKGFKLVLQGDGNLVQSGANGTVFWTSNTAGHPNIWDVSMQADGNLVVRDAHSVALWASGTAGNTGAFFVVQDDGNLVIYNVHGVAIWSTGPK